MREIVKLVNIFLGVCSIACHAWLRASVVYVPTCYVTASFTSQRACVPTYQKSANFLFLRVNVPKGMSIFRTFPLRKDKANLYTLLLYEKLYIVLDIIVIHIHISYLYVPYTKAVLYFISILHETLKKSGWNFLFYCFFSFNKSFLKFSTAKTTKQHKEYL